MLGRQLPRHDGQRALPDVRDHAARDPVELLRRVGLPGADGRAERARPAAARSGAGGIVPRGWRRLLEHVGLGVPGAAGVGAAAWAACPRHDRSVHPGHARGLCRVLVLRAPRAADPGEEGVHDAPVPLGGDVPRLPPRRRIGGELLAVGHEAELRALPRAARARERRRDGEPHRAEEFVPARAVDQRAPDRARPPRRAAPRGLPRHADAATATLAIRRHAGAGPTTMTTGTSIRSPRCA